MWKRSDIQWSLKYPVLFLEFVQSIYRAARVVWRDGNCLQWCVYRHSYVVVVSWQDHRVHADVGKCPTYGKCTSTIHPETSGDLSQVHVDTPTGIGACFYQEGDNASMTRLALEN